ncbi:hypothetical protein M947_07325 [Sulfurimonas hongkongensis]|uniref:Lipoprotein n=1 Tax=Sulfurimonas hongkongensis TaxID=1172190 RepID=T0JR07_9BACT|nr:hypothetical protein [Sulfurimonas hongkongensis]EQB39272.1 hypothetical protein M947_07325 [Sulfurimonas hongkongensis]
MIKILLLFLTLLLFNACSFKSPPNDWQYKSVSAFESYTKNFLGANDAMAKDDLMRAINHAKQGADLKALSRIYLAKCALNIIVGVKDECKEFQDISILQKDASSDAYFAFIQQKNDYDINELDASYQNFAARLKAQEYKEANKAIMKISKPTSKLLAAALIRDKLTSKTRDEIIKTASFNGYKKSSLFWLNEKVNHTKDINEKERLIKKIEALR